MRLLGYCSFRCKALWLLFSKLQWNSFCLFKTCFARKIYHRSSFFWEIFKLFRLTKNQASCIDDCCCDREQYHCNPMPEVLMFHDDIAGQIFDSDWQSFRLWYLKFINSKIHNFHMIAWNDSIIEPISRSECSIVD